jgi:hypothetical protein
MTDSPFKFSELMQLKPGLLTQEVTTYLKQDNAVFKIVVKRNFTDDDYTDSMTTEVLTTW